MAATYFALPTFRATTYTTQPGRDPDGHIFRPSKKLVVEVYAFREKVEITLRAGETTYFSGPPADLGWLRTTGFTAGQIRGIQRRALSTLDDPSTITI